MNQKNIKRKWSFYGLGVGLVILFSLAGCNRPTQDKPTQTQDFAGISTQAALTVLAEFTRQAAEAGPQFTWTPAPEPTDTRQPAQFPTQTQPDQATAIPPTAVPTRVLPSDTPVVCNRAQFVRDITVQDQAPFAPDDSFVKIWRVKNTGSCTWTQDYALVLVSGSALGAKKVIELPQKVAPNQTVDLAIPMQAPATLGSYRGDWKLSTPSGDQFGVGANGTTSLYVAIRVINMTNPALAYDFAANICKAEWRSALGVLPCPGTSSGTEGFAILLDQPRLENRQEDELTLWTHPNQAAGGWIKGTYPVYEIKPGQHFVAWVGCLDDSKGCNVTFRLDFLNTKNDSIKNLGIWQEVYDGKVTKIDLDLSDQAGKTVKFILTVSVAGGDPARANAFWFVPGLVQAAPTATPTETATATSEPAP